MNLHSFILKLSKIWQTFHTPGKPWLDLFPEYFYVNSMAENHQKIGSIHLTLFHATQRFTDDQRRFGLCLNFLYRKYRIDLF